MRINGFSGTNTQTGIMGMTQGNDSVSKKIFRIRLQMHSRSYRTYHRMKKCH